MLAQGIPVEKIVEIWCICERTMYNWISDYICNGFDCFRIVKRPGRKELLTPQQKEKLKEIIDNGPEEYGFDVARKLRFIF